MENKILELLERKGSVSMNDDIFPLVEKEFEGQVASIETFEVSEIMAKINAVKDVYDSLADSTVQNCIDGLNETDKAEIQKRIAAAKAELDSLDEKYGALSAIEVDVSGKPAGEWTAAARYRFRRG